MNKLTPKQTLFVKEYLVDLNAAQAAKRAGYSEKTATAIGGENLGKPTIKAAIQAEMTKRGDKIDITAEIVLKEIAKIAMFDIRKMYKDDGSMIPIHELPDDVACAIGGLDIKALYDDKQQIGEVMKYKIIDKLKSLEMLGRNLVLFTDSQKVEHSGEINMTSILNANDQGGIPEPPV